MNKAKSISFGDKIFARVTRNGQTIFNFVSEKVSNMTDLLSQLRIAMKDIQGLVMIHIRNFNQGWGEERPLMLYAKKTNNFNRIEVQIQENEFINSMSRQMYFPWETH